MHAIIKLYNRIKLLLRFHSTRRGGTFLKVKSAIGPEDLQEGEMGETLEHIVCYSLEGGHAHKSCRSSLWGSVPPPAMGFLHLPPTPCIALPSLPRSHLGATIFTHHLATQGSSCTQRSQRHPTLRQEGFCHRGGSAGDPSPAFPLPPPPCRSPLRMAASRSLRASLMGISGICGFRGSTAGAGGDAECAGEAATAGGPGGGGGGATGGPMGPACGGEAE